MEHIASIFEITGCCCPAQSSQAGNIHNNHFVVKMHFAKVGLKELTRFVTFFFACCVPDNSDFEEDFTNIINVLPDVSHDDNDRGAQTGVVYIVLSTEKESSIVPGPDQ